MKKSKTLVVSEKYLAFIFILLTILTNPVIKNINPNKIFIINTQ